MDVDPVVNVVLVGLGGHLAESLGDVDSDNGAGVGLAMLCVQVVYPAADVFHLEETLPSHSASLLDPSPSSELHQFSSNLISFQPLPKSYSNSLCISTLWLSWSDSLY